jgi:hypothetical protein
MDTLLTFVPTSLSFSAWKAKYSMAFSSVNELPPNVHLLTLEEWAGNSRDSVLLRLEHQVSPRVLSMLSKPLKEVFQRYLVKT